jgi:hypothetical protein
MPIRAVNIPSQICGPPDSGNGGYTCGLLASTLGGNAEITLRKPIPLNAEMRIEPRNGVPGVVLLHGDELIAEGNSADWEVHQVPRISFEMAATASKKSPAFQGHPFPTCFVCGPDREYLDGLRIFPGPIQLDGKDFFAASWTPYPWLGDSQRHVREEFIWAALDCPTGFAGGFPSYGTLVTGRLGAKMIDHVRVGEKCVLLSWQLGIDGRKHHAACVLIGENGSVKAQSYGTWIRLDSNGAA